MADEEQRLRDAQREYLDFLDDEVCITGAPKYSQTATADSFRIT